MLAAGQYLPAFYKNLISCRSLFASSFKILNISISLKGVVALPENFSALELAQLTGGGLGRSKPKTNLMQAH